MKLNTEDHRRTPNKSFQCFSVFDSFRKIINSLKDNRFQTFLLYNAAYKELTEIYLRLIEESLRANKSAIMLVPEIVFTPKYITRFKERLGDNLFCLHSGIKLSERKKNWHQIRKLDYSVVLGTRSAIFAPVNNLGLIIVDTEHDLSYKEKERHFHYNARDIAVVRAQINNATAVLASTTPSIESFHNTKIGKYELVTMPREEKKDLNKVLLVDMRRSKNRIISPKLQYEIQSAYNKRKPIVLFLNRRGFARVIICNDCGHTPHCPACGIPLVLHSDGKFFICNICKYREFAFDYCPKCKGNDFLYQGIGTQQVVKEVKKLFPKADILRLDSDTEKNSNVKSQRSKLSKIIITTRLGIRGLDFAQIGLFGVISADTSLFIPDFRAQEKTFQELSKIIQESSVNKDCKIIIQTYHSDNYAIYLAVQENYLKFYEQEINLRKNLQYPPFSRLASISVTSGKTEYAKEIAEKITAKIQPIKDIIVLGPSARTQAKKPSMHTYQILIKMISNQSLSNFISRADLIFNKAEIDINIDPL